MPYEREAIADSTSAIPTQAPVVMREERTVDPTMRPRPTPLGESIGQPGIKREIEAVESKPAEEAVTLSPQVSALARKEQKVRQQEQALKAKEQELEAKLAKFAKYEAMDAKLSQKDYSALDEVGIDYNEYTQYQVNKLNGQDPTQEAFRKLESEVTELKKTTQDNLSKQYEAAVSERRKAVNELLESNPQFIRVKKANASEAVVQHILDTWENDNEELSVEQATKEVDEILSEKAKKWSALLEEEKREAAEEDKKTLPPLKPGLKTLTNQVTAGDLKRPVKSYQHMNDSERWAEARRRAEEKLQTNSR